MCSSQHKQTYHITDAVQAIDTLALNLQNKFVFPHCLAFAKEAIQSGDHNIRAAACTVLVVVAEGCCDACTSHLPEVLQVVLFPLPCHLARASIAKVTWLSCYGWWWLKAAVTPPFR